MIDNKNVAGVTPQKYVSGKKASTISVTDKLLVETDEELYTRKAVRDILIKYDWFVRGYNIADDNGDTQESAYLFARYLSHDVSGTWWEGIDVFMGEDK